jgi:SAM-dependent methyltransferase
MTNNNTWEKNFVNFSKKFNIIKTLGEYNYKKYIYLTSKDDTILDFGCGSGELINFFKEKNFKKIFGYDVTDNLINPNLKSIVITDLSANFRGLDKINFNIVFFNGCLHHLNEPFETIKKLRDIYKENSNKKRLKIIILEPINTPLRLLGEFIILKTFIGKNLFKDLKNCLIAEWSTYEPWKKLSNYSINQKLTNLGFKKEKMKRTLFNIELIYVFNA